MNNSKNHHDHNDENGESDNGGIKGDEVGDGLITIKTINPNTKGIGGISASATSVTSDVIMVNKKVREDIHNISSNNDNFVQKKKR